jgi:hypothetical protein
MDEFLDQLIDDQLPKKDWHSIPHRCNICFMAEKEE